jgi:hypothetical protein
MAELVTRRDLEVVRNDLDGRIAAVRNDLEVLRRDMEGAIDRLSLRITVRMGVMLAAGIAVLATLIQLS